MKRYNTFYYLLFVLLIMGAFASMAQNTYGVKLMGFVCLGFAMMFLHEIIFAVDKRDDLLKSHKRWLILELSALSAIACLSFFRIRLIEVPLGKELIIILLAILLLIYFSHMLINARLTWRNDKKLFASILFYYGSLLTFIGAFLMGIIRPAYARFIGTIAISLLIGFGILVLLFRDLIFRNERVSVIQYITRMKNKSVILLIGFIMIFGFIGLNEIKVLPPLYSGEMPSGYVKLVQQAESDPENSSTAKKRYEEFDKNYRQFMRNK